jgi:hypothetical protein
MSTKFLKRLVHGTLVIIFWSVSIKTALPQSAVSPYLSLKFSEANNQKGKSPQSPVMLKRAERLEFQIGQVPSFL